MSVYCNFMYLPFTGMEFVFEGNLGLVLFEHRLAVLSVTGALYSASVMGGCGCTLQAAGQVL